MSFYIYVFIYFFTGLLALWFFLFLLKNRNEDSALTRIMLLTSLVSVLWCIADFLTIFSFFSDKVQIVFWRTSFFFSWTLISLFFFFIKSFLKVFVNKLTHYALLFIYLSAAYHIVFTDKIIAGIRPLSFSGDSNYLLGEYFFIVMSLFVWFLFLVFYLIIKDYLKTEDKIQKDKLRALVFSLGFLFLTTVFSNLLFPSLGIQFPRLAVLGVAIVILALFQIIYKWQFFGFINTALKLRTKLVFVFISLAFIPLLLLSYLFFNSVSDNTREQFIKSDQQVLSLAEEKLNNFFSQAEKDTFFLSRLQSLEYLINGQDVEQNKQRLAENFLVLAEIADIYYQIRYIDENGDEIVRVDSNGTEHFVVEEQALQNKKDRYYFQDSSTLAKGSLYVSPLDLNVERNEIEIPYRPVIRYATPVFDQNKNHKGIIIINIEARYLLDELKNIFVNGQEVYVVDQAGYFLLHPDKTKEWGKDLKNDHNILQSERPNLAENILQQNKILVNFDEKNKEYLSSQRVYFSEPIKSVQRPVSDEQYLIVLLSSKDFIVNQTSNDSVMILLRFGLILLLLVVFLSIFLSKILSDPFKKLARSIELVSQNNLNYQMEVNSHDEIGKIAQAFNQLIAWLKKSRQEVDKKVVQQTKDILTKNEKLEKQEQAILNILEDTEQDKKNIELLAKDLEKFKLAVSNASDHIVITDGEGNILYANQAVERITGFKVSEILGKKAGAKDLWGGLMEKEFYHKMWDTLKNKKQVFEGKITNKRKNGEKYVAFSSISPILNSKKEVSFFLGIERDITEEEQVNQAKTEFVSLASHQLRTPLSAINWYAEMLLAGDAGEINAQQKQFLEEIYKGNQRMVDLVNALLNVSRIELGTLAVEPVSLNLSDIVDSVINELKNGIKTKQLKIIKNYSKENSSFKGDVKLIRILWQNILSNAVKYTPAKGKIEITINKKAKEILLSVADNGYGIPKNQQDRIFTKLFRADNVRDKETDGTGLGLYIVKAIVDAAGGKIWLESEENKGTTFYVSLPSIGMKKKEGSKGLENTK